MTIQFATAHNLRSIAGTAVFGLGLNFASCRMTQFFWFIVSEAVSLLWRVALAGWQISQGQIFGFHVYSLGCPLQMLLSFRPVLDLVGAAV